MTISTTIIKNSYSGDGSVVAFTYAFKIADATFIEVIVKTNATGAESVRAIGTGTTNYAVTGVGEAAGGTVTFVTAPLAAETVVLRRSTLQTQALDLIENDNLPANSLENAFDKNLSIAQELQEQLDRSFKVSRTNTITSSEFTDSATARASKALGFDSDGNLTTVADFLPAGGDSAQFTYSTTVTDADPGSGFIRFNNTTISSATIAYIDDLEANGTDVVAWVQSFDDVSGNATNRGRIRVSKANTLDTWHVFKVNAAITDASGYTKIPLTYIDGAGSLTNNDKVFVSFVASGEDGAIPGYFYKFDAGTSDADPGAGDIAFNNATYANVTEIYIDDADANGGATQADTETWGSSTSTIKGFLHIVDINDRSTYARFKVTAAVDDESGYNKITVVHLASNNTFSAADELSVHFTRTGLKGDTGATGSTGPTGATGDVSLAGTQTLTNKTLTAPKIGTSILDTNGNELALLTATGSAVNELTIANAATGANPTISATGGDTNVGINLTPKGTGEIVIGAGNLNYGGTAITSTGAELNLLDGVSGLVQADLTKLAAIDATAAELDTLDALSRGSLIYGNASAATAILTKGSADQVLTSDGTDIAWASAGGGGKILQVVSITKTDTFSSTTTSFVDVTGMTASITPSATSSKILVLVDCKTASDADCKNAIKLVRGSTDISVGASASSRSLASAAALSKNTQQFETQTIMHLDSPSSTSSVTYKIQCDTEVNFFLNRTSSDSDGQAHYRTASNIILMEIGA